MKRDRGSAGTRTEMSRDQPVHRLRANSIGLLGVMFLLIGATGPLLSVLGNVPIEVASGNGVAAPAGYLWWLAGLLLFAVGYAQMSSRLVATGGFYSYISRGLGRPAGAAAGWSALAAYAVGEAGIFGALGYFAANTFATELGLHLSWLIYSAVGLAIVTALSYRDVRLTTRVLGVLGMFEVVILLVVDAAVLAQGGRHGLTLQPLNPARAFSGPSPAIGLLFAFLSWVGFEMIPNYAEETANPGRNSRRGLYLGVVLLGVLFVLSAWAGIVGNGTDSSVALASKDPVDFYYRLSTTYVGGWATDILKWLLVTSCFALCLVWHQTTSRYFYALGREHGPSRLGRTHARWRSPHVAVLVQAVVVIAWVGAFLLMYGTDRAVRRYAGDFATAPYAELFAWLLVATILLILVNEFLCSLAVINYFRTREKAGLADWLRTLVAPGLAAALMGVMLVVAVTHVGTIGGDIGYVRAVPWVCLAWVVLGFGVAFWLKAQHPDAYSRIGAFVEGLDETREGREVSPSHSRVLVEAEQQSERRSRG